MILSLMLVGSSSVWAAEEFSLGTPEPRPAVTKARIVDIVIHTVTQQALVTVAKGYMEAGEFVSVKERTIIFLNDETSTDYTDFMQTIKLNRSALKALIKAKVDAP